MKLWTKTCFETEAKGKGLIKIFRAVSLLLWMNECCEHRCSYSCFQFSLQKAILIFGAVEQQAKNAGAFDDTSE